jgi:hypothetical protein
MTAYGAMLHIDREAHAKVTASADRCRDLLADVVGYPRWSSLIKSAEPVGDRVRLRVELLGTGLEMDCTLEVGVDRVVLERLPHDAADKERFQADWKLGEREVALHVTGSIDAPGPARLIRGRVERRLADDLLDDFTRAL